MAFVRPSLSELIDRGRDDLNGRFPGADSRLRRSMLDVLARLHAGGLHGVYGYLDWIARQGLPDTADAEQLARWASIWGVTRKGAEPARGAATATGTNGVEIAEGTLLQRADGAEYAVLADVTIAGGTATLALQASAPGAAGQAIDGVILTFASPIGGVAAEASVSGGGLIGGADEESDDALRARLLDRIRRPPNGGSASDYERWALEVPGVTRAWVYPEADGPGTVSVAFVMDGREDIIPTGGDVTAVGDHIAPLRPVTADVTVFAPASAPLDLTIALVPDTSDVRAAVAAELTDLLAREAEPGGTILLSHIQEAISIAAGETDHVLSDPVADVACAAGDIAILGTITWS